MGSEQAMGGSETGRGRAPWAVCCLALMVSALQLLWLTNDSRVPFMDQHRYWLASTAAERHLDQGDLWGVATLRGTHPPLYPILGACTMTVLGGGYHDARMVNVLLAALTTFASYLLARRSLGPWGACLAAALTSFAPLLFAFQHMYYVEACLVPVVLLTWWWLLCSDGLRRRRSWVVLGALLGLGCLTKWTYPVFVVAPLAVSVWRSGAVRALACAVGLAAVMAGPWYVVNAQAVVAFFQGGVVGGEGYMSAQTGLDGLLYYPRQLALVGLGLPCALAAMAGFVVLLRRDRPMAVRMLVWTAIPVLTFSLVMTKKPRHLLPVVPALAIAASHGVLSIKRRDLRVALSLLLTGQVAAAALQGSFCAAADQLTVPLADRRLPLLSEPSPVPGPPEVDRWPYARVLQALEEAGARDDSTPVLLLFNLTGFREDGFWYVRDLRGRSMALGLIPFSWPPGHPAHEPYPLDRVAADTPGLLDARFILAKTGTMWVRYGRGRKLHEYGARTSEALFDPDSALRKAFSLEEEVPLPDGSRLGVFVARDHPGRSEALRAWSEAEADGGAQVDAYRTGDDPAGAALQLASLRRDRPGQAARWLRRALEADDDAEDRVRAAMKTLGVPSPTSSGEELLPHLRRLDGGR